MSEETTKNHKIRVKRVKLCIWEGGERVPGYYEEKGEWYLTLWIERSDPYWYHLAFDIDNEETKIRMYSSCSQAIVKGGFDLPHGIVLHESFTMIRSMCYNDEKILKRKKKRVDYKKLFKRRSFLIHVLIGEIRR